MQILGVLDIRRIDTDDCLPGSHDLGRTDRPIGDQGIIVTDLYQVRVVVPATASVIAIIDLDPEVVVAKLRGRSRRETGLPALAVRTVVYS